MMTKEKENYMHVLQRYLYSLSSHLNILDFLKLLVYGWPKTEWCQFMT